MINTCVKGYRLGSMRNRVYRKASSTVTSVASMFSPRFCVASSKIAPLNVEEYMPVSIVSNSLDGEGFHLLQIQVPPIIAQEFKYPGQYVKIRSLKEKGLKPSYFAICSSPSIAQASSISTIPTNEDDDRMETENDNNTNPTTLTFLVKDLPIHQYLLQTPLFALDWLEMSLPLGKGFPIHEKRFFTNQQGVSCSFTSPSSSIQHILLFATGSGIAPILSFLENQKLFNFPNKNLKSITLFVGGRTPKHFPLQTKLHQHHFILNEHHLENNNSFSETVISHKITNNEALKVHFFPVISQPDHEFSKGWKGHIGYVQDVLLKEQDNLPLASSTMALLCGQKAMIDEVTKILEERGIPKDHILTNF